MAAGPVPRETVYLTQVELGRIAKDAVIACQHLSRAAQAGDRAAVLAYLEQIAVLTRVATALAEDLAEGPS